MYGRMRRVVPALLIAAAACAAAPGAALAGEARVDGDTVVFDAGLGEENHIDVAQVSGGTFTQIIQLHDPQTITPGPGCSIGPNATTVSCGVDTLGQIPHVQLNLGNKNDSARPAFLNPVDTFMEINGGPGDDILTGSTDIDTIDGGDGADQISGAGSHDHLFGFYGNDVVDGDDGNDELDGGPGDDELNGDAGADVISGALGADTLRGGTENDTLSGNAGQDKLLGNAGKDKYFGGTEADSITSEDDQAETVDCGGGLFSGADKANVDSSDTAIGCEVVV